MADHPGNSGWLRKIRWVGLVLMLAAMPALPLWDFFFPLPMPFLEGLPLAVRTFILFTAANPATHFSLDVVGLGVDGFLYLKEWVRGAIAKGAAVPVFRHRLVWATGKDPFESAPIPREALWIRSSA